MSILKVGIPKGSLEKSTIELFGRAGWKIRSSSRNYFPSVDDSDLRLSLVRAQEMSRYVEGGVLDAGLTGKDWILENDSDVVEVCDLVYSKVSTNPARWVLVVPGDSPCNKPEDLEGKKIATEMVGFTKRFFEERGINVEVEFSWGATEAKVVEGLCDAIVEVTETGSTIKAHGLKIIETLLVTNTKFIASKAAYADPEKRRKIDQIALLLQAALRAEDMVGLKMNVADKVLEEVVELLPSVQAPTVANLFRSDWLSVETVVPESVVREVVPALMELGATGIIEYPLNKII
ncbi:MAG: ATP phosphoribosyltransferase [Deltaproteobacteria bacterium]|nr:MAG: ATP phosphoribosyltransferase [Deltaproteobacteria bacterium]